MSVLKVSGCRDIAGLGGFDFASGAITARSTLKVTDLNINGSISGSSNHIIPSMSGQSGKFLSTNGSNLEWVQGAGGIAGLSLIHI